MSTDPCRTLIALLALLPCRSIALAGDPAASLDIELRVSPIVDLYYEVRARAAEGEEPKEGDALAGAIAAASALEGELGSILAWGPIDGGIGAARSGADLEAVFAKLPESFALRQIGGGTREVKLRERAAALARALVEAEEHWLLERWPERERRLSARAEELRARLASDAGRALLDELCDTLGPCAAGLSVPVLVALRAPDPGAVTYRAGGANAVVVLGVSAFEGTALLETLVHESIHALEVAGGKDTLLAALRAALAAAGIGPLDRRSRDVPHALFFIHAAELVRRHFDPTHVDYGESGAYARLAAPIAAQRELWRAYLAGDLPRADLVRELVAAARS